MNMNWLEKYKPTNLNEFTTNKDEVIKAMDWIKRYKEDPDITKKVLLIIGNTGCGKTLLANLIFQDFNYQKIELNSTDVRSQKKLGDFLKKSLTFKNVIDMFYEEKMPIGILLDEIDTLSNLADKGGLNEFLDILKTNDKCYLYKKNLNNKKKNRKQKISVDNYIKLYNPIICTSNDVNDKKINELKKYSEIIYLKKSPNHDLIYIIDHIYSIVNQTIDENIKEKLVIYSQYDIRRLIILIENLYYFSNNEHIDEKIFDKFIKTYDKKEEDIQLLDSTYKLLYEKMPIKKSQLLFEIDCLLTPLTIYHNSIDYVKNTDDPIPIKFNSYKNVLQSLCYHDIIQTNIFEIQDWNELYDYASIYGSSLPNYYFSKLNTIKNKPIQIEFTSLLNKICQMYINKKLLNNAKYFIDKLNVDNDEIIYFSGILSHFLEKYKMYDEEDNDDDINDNNITNYDIINQSILDDQSIDNHSIDNHFQNDYLKLKKNNDSELLLFMNKYNISIVGLENIIKIEKLNMNTDKKKKKMTTKIKKNILSFLI